MRALRPATDRSMTPRWQTGGVITLAAGDVSPGLLGFVVVALIGVALYILIKSMNKQMSKIQMDRPIAVREAILACRSGGIVSILGVYAGFVDKFPLGALMNRGLTIRTGQCHVHRYMQPLLDRIVRGELDPSFVVSHHMNLDDAPSGYDMFVHKRDNAMKILLHT